jgi:hypothetical protein
MTCSLTGCVTHSNRSNGNLSVMDGPEPDLYRDGIFRIDLYATVIFSIVAIAATLFPGPLRIPFAVLSCVLFAIGTIAFLWAYGKAIERSREQDVSVAMIYGMTGVVPTSVSRRFHLLTFVQSAVAITTAAIRPFTAQAFGILAPMLGLGLAGLWAARHGTFAERKDGRHKAREMNRTKNG